MEMVYAHQSLFSLDEHRHGIAAAEAQRGDAEPAAAALECTQQRHQHPRAARSDRMAQCNCAAVDIHAIGRQLELAHAGEHLHGERFVDLEQIDFIERAVRPWQQRGGWLRPAR